MSIEYPRVLMRRARSYLRAAQRSLSEELYDIAGVEAEIAARLAVKALIAFLGFEPPRIYRVRRLLARLAEILGDTGGIVREFVAAKRDKLVILERAREAGQYGAEGLDEYEARVCVETAEEVVKLVEELWRRLGSGDRSL